MRPAIQCRAWSRDCKGWVYAGARGGYPEYCDPCKRDRDAERKRRARQAPVDKEADRKLLWKRGLSDQEREAAERAAEAGLADPAFFADLLRAEYVPSSSGRSLSRRAVLRRIKRATETALRDRRDVMGPGIETVVDTTRRITTTGADGLPLRHWTHRPRRDPSSIKELIAAGQRWAREAPDRPPLPFAEVYEDDLEAWRRAYREWRAEQEPEDDPPIEDVAAALAKNRLEKHRAKMLLELAGYGNPFAVRAVERMTATGDVWAAYTWYLRRVYADSEPTEERRAA